MTFDKIPVLPCSFRKNKDKLAIASSTKGDELEGESPHYSQLPAYYTDFELSQCKNLSGKCLSSPGLSSCPEDPLPRRITEISGPLTGFDAADEIYSTVIPLHKRTKSLRTKSNIFEDKLRTLNRNLKRRLTFTVKDKPRVFHSKTAQGPLKAYCSILEIHKLDKFSSFVWKNNSSNQKRKMSLNGEENGLLVNDSFWEMGNYKRTCKRIDDGLKLCHDFITMIKERGDIESKYSDDLRQWSKKWNKLVEKGPEYGTCERAWCSVFEEADGLADVHTRVKDRLVEEVASTVKVWHKENFHQKALGGIKESKEIDDAFRKAQKQWAKLYVKADKCKKDYHTACKQEKSSINQDKNAQGDTSVSVDQQKKLSEKVEKCREDREKTKDAYESSLKEINACNAKYMEDMTIVFEKCQEMEQKRLKFFKEMLFGVHKCLDLTQDKKLPCIYNNFNESIQSLDPQQDLTWWSHNHGTAMPMNWPTFEDYVEDLHPIAAPSNKMKGHIANNTIQLKGVYAQKFQEEFVEYSPELRSINKKARPQNEPVSLIAQRPTTTSPSSNPIPTSSSGDKNEKKNVKENGLHNSAEKNNTSTNSSPIVRPSSATESAVSPTELPSAPPDDEWDMDSGEPGVPVTALYDYQAQEDDELSFFKGDEFEKLEDEDEQGWCKGRKAGRVGLYPANYAVPV